MHKIRTEDMRRRERRAAQSRAKKKRADEKTERQKREGETESETKRASDMYIFLYKTATWILALVVPAIPMAVLPSL